MGNNINSNSISGINSTETAAVADFSLFEVEVDADVATTATATATATDNDDDGSNCNRNREPELGLERKFTKTVITKKGKYTDRGYTKEQHERWYKMFKQLVKYKNHVYSCSYEV